MGASLGPGVAVAGRYTLVAALGRGGMGAVWSASDPVMRREVALKFLRGPAHLRADLRRRFLLEVRAACTVEHPNVVQVHDVLEYDDETPVMVMELLAGETLGARLRRVDALDVETTASILMQIVSAIGTAHARGVIHRDLKPDNVFLVEGAPGAEVRVLDFGVAKLFAQPVPTAAPDSVPVTHTGAMLGTPCYMAPEQAIGKRDVDHRIDIWSLGAIAYECLSSARPIEGESLGQVIEQLLNTGIAPLSRIVPDVPEELGALVDRMLARDRQRRPGDLREVMAVLGRYTRVTAPPFGAPGSEVRAVVAPIATRVEPSTPRRLWWRVPTIAALGGSLLLVGFTLATPADPRAPAPAVVPATTAVTAAPLEPPARPSPLATAAPHVAEVGAPAPIEPSQHPKASATKRPGKPRRRSEATPSSPTPEPVVEPVEPTTIPAVGGLVEQPPY